MTYEDSINNSWQIVEEFKCRKLKQSRYCAPKKVRHVARPESHGPVRIYTEKEKYLFAAGRLLNNLTVCGN